MKNETPYMIFGSWQAHATTAFVDDGVCPTIGCTDFGLPRLILLKNE